MRISTRLLMALALSACGSPRSEPDPGTERAVVAVEEPSEGPVAENAPPAEPSPDSPGPGSSAAPTDAGPADAGPADPPLPANMEAEVARLRAAVAASPGDARAACTLGTQLRRASRFIEATEVLVAAVRVARRADLPPGAFEACQYELGRSYIGRGMPGPALDAFRVALQTPVERRRPLVREALVGVQRALAAEDCNRAAGYSGLGPDHVGLRALLAQGEDAAVRACVEQLPPLCTRLDRRDPDYPGTDPSQFDAFRRATPSLAFGTMGTELLIITGEGPRAVVRSCALELPDGNMVGLALRRVRAQGAEIFAVKIDSYVSYSCECDGDEGGDGADGDDEGDDEENFVDCRCTDAFYGDLFFSSRGAFRLALVRPDSTNDGMPGVRWDHPELRVEDAYATPEGGEGDHLAPFGRFLFVRNGALVPGARVP